VQRQRVYFCGLQAQKKYFPEFAADYLVEHLMLAVTEQ
jgi:hypothetical protein